MINKHYDYSNPTSVWETVKKKIELDIICGRYAAGDKAPSMAQIEECYNVSLVTASRVLERLKKEGTICMEKGKGYYIMPFAKEKLVKDHRERLIESVVQISKHAVKLGFDVDGMVEIIKEAWPGVTLDSG